MTELSSEESNNKDVLRNENRDIYEMQEISRFVWNSGVLVQRGKGEGMLLHK